MKKYIIILLALLLVGDICAQDTIQEAVVTPEIELGIVKDSLEYYKREFAKLKEKDLKVAPYRKQINVAEDSIKKLNNCIKNKDAKIDGERKSLNDSIGVLNAEIAELGLAVKVADSVITDYKDQMIQFEKDVAELQNDKAVFERLKKKSDIIVTKLIVVCLDNRSGIGTINDLCEFYDNITDDSLRRQNDKNREILSLYVETTDALIELARKCITEVNKDASSHLHKTVTVGDYISEVKQLEYVKKSYHKDEYYTSYYINDLLPYDAIEDFENASPGDKKGKLEILLKEIESIKDISKLVEE